jgi:hypothetical protein
LIPKRSFGCLISQIESMRSDVVSSLLVLVQM